MLSHHVDTYIIIAITKYLLHLMISLSQWLQELIVVLLKLVLSLAVTSVLGSIGILSHIQAVNTHFLHDSFLSLADSQHTILEGDTFEHRTTLQLSVELSKGSIITQKMLLVGWSSLPQSHLLSVLVHSSQKVNGTLASVSLWDGWSLGILWQIIILLPLVQVMLKLVIAQGESGIPHDIGIVLIEYYVVVIAFLSTAMNHSSRVFNASKANRRKEFTYILWFITHHHRENHRIYFFKR